MILYPTSQKAMDDPNFNLQIVCLHCVDVEQILKSDGLYAPRNLAQERRESIDFTRKKQ